MRLEGRQGEKEWKEYVEMTEYVPASVANLRDAVA